MPPKPIPSKSRSPTPDPQVERILTPSPDSGAQIDTAAFMALVFEPIIPAQSTTSAARSEANQLEDHPAYKFYDKTSSIPIDDRL